MVYALCREVELKKNYTGTKNSRSIYFGGGTPSLLSPAELDLIFKTLHNYFDFNSQAEITLEANPDDITKETLLHWKKAGINRLSIGLQSFNDAELKWMNRAHSAEESETAVKLAQEAGFDNITIDLIYGSKFQDLKSWEKTLQKAIALNTQHISSYNLTIENKTVLGTNFEKGKEPAVDEGLSSQQFLLMSEMLRASGFVHYEISNFGKENFFAVHNSNYWRGHLYTGIGPSAHSYNGIERQWNIKNNAQYISKINAGDIFYETETLTPDNKYNEYVLTRLRTIWGCDISEMEQLFGKKYVEHFINSVAAYKEYFVVKDNLYTLNDKGRLLADGIAAELFI